MTININCIVMSSMIFIILFNEIVNEIDDEIQIWNEILMMKRSLLEKSNIENNDKY